MASDISGEKGQPDTIIAGADGSVGIDGDEAAPPENGENKVDTLHTALSNRIDLSANWIDSFFRDERIEIEEENTSLRLKLSSFFERGESVDFKVKARFRVVLPHLENKVHLFASSVLEEDDRDLEYFDDTENRDDDRRNFYLSLRYFFKAAKRQNISIRTGLRFHKWTPAVFIGPRVSFSRKLDTWNFRFIEDVNWYSDDGWESKTSVDLEKPVSDEFFFRTNLDGRWYENDTGYFYSFNNDLYQTISENQALRYQLSVKFETRPSNRMTEVLLRIRYRQGFWRDWLFLEISPQIAFRREDHYDPSPGITLSIEGLFGKDFLKHAF
jgi:hypothetical protein